jgi:hypothetical protein
MFEVNTTSKHPTHFLRAVELIIFGRNYFSVPSENWPYPTEYRLGCPNEWYYAEIWSDGMDWQPTYWVIEEKKLENPQVQPFIIFKENLHRELFNDYDFDKLIKASLWYRRDKFWVHNNDLGYYTDAVWPNLNVIDMNNTAKKSKLTKVYYEHASQQRIYFLMNLDFIPSEYWKFKRLDKGDSIPSGGRQGDMGY